jgi:hypothetical protein
MHKLVIAVAALGLSAGAAFAQTSFTDVDADANGELSYAELQVAWPNLTQDEFTTADADASSGLSTSELATLQPPGDGAAAAPAETLPAPVASAPVDDAPETLAPSSGH